MILDLTLGFLCSVLDGLVVDISILKGEAGIIVPQNKGFAAQLEELFVVMEVTRNLGPLLLDRVLDLSMPCVEMQEFEGSSLFGLLLQEHIDEEDLLVLAD